MTKWRFCVNSGFLGARRSRFTRYQPDRSLEEKFELASQIEGIEGIELKYPADLAEVPRVKRLLDDTNLLCSAVNVDIKDATYFRHGALSARSREARNRAAAMLKEGMDVAADLGTDLVSTCPLADGYDYPFQTDYETAWGHFSETVKEVVSHRGDVRLALEFQPQDPQARIMLRNVGMVLHVCAEVGASNLGANLDIGHSFAASETPAESIALLAGKGRLFYLHSNDNTGDGGDWDMISGSVHFWHWLEVIYTLQHIGYEGWIGGDIEVKQMGPVEAYSTNVRMIRRMTAFVRRAGVERIDAYLRQDGKTAEIFDYLSGYLMPEN
jgi:xylose isomerase